MVTHSLASRAVAATSSATSTTTSASCPRVNCSISFVSALQLQPNPDISGIGVRPRSLFWMPCAGFFTDDHWYHLGPSGIRTLGLPYPLLLRCLLLYEPRWSFKSR